MGRFKAIKGIEYLKGIRLIDQQPIGRTPRSNPITYLKAFDEIRQLFAAEREAQRQGLTPGHFPSMPPAAAANAVKAAVWKSWRCIFRRYLRTLRGL